MSGATASARVQLDSKDALDGFKRLEEAGKHSFTEINSAVELAQKAFGVVTSVIGTAVELGGKWAAASAEAERAQTRLAAASGEQYEALKTFNDELQRKIGLDDDEAAAVETKLLALGVLPSQLEQATKATVGLSEATGKGLLFSTKEVARAFQDGGTEAQRLEGLFGLAEAASRTFSGEVTKLETSLGNMEESLGGAITQSSGLKDGMDAMSTAFGEFAAIFESDEFRTAIDSLFRMLIGWSASTINAFLGARQAVLDLRKAVQGDNDAVTIEGEDGSIEVLHVDPQVPAAIAALQKLADQLTTVANAPAKTSPNESGEGLDLAKTPKEKRPKGAKAPSEQDLDTAVAGLDIESLSNADEVGDAGVELRKHEFAQKEELAKAEAALEAERTQQMVQQNELRFQGELKAYQARQQLEQRQLDATKAFQGQLVSIGLGGTSRLISGMVNALLSGKGDLDDAAKQLFGGMLQQLGTALMSMGTAAIAAGTLGTAAPIFAPFTGGPAGVTAGIALVAAGAVLAGTGAAIAGSAGGSSAGSAPSTPKTATLSLQSAETRGFQGDGNQQGGTTVYNIYPQGIFADTERQLGRKLRQMIAGADELRSGDWTR